MSATDPSVSLGSFDGLMSEEPFPGVVRRGFSSEHATVNRYSFAPGAAFPTHRHPQEQITVILEGDMELSTADGVERLSAGDWTVFAGDVEHGLRAGDGGATIIAIIVPRRERADAYTVTG
jgi:quercetin dioxygenase-like cupin family protein